MNFYWIKTNWIVKRLFSSFVWDLPNKTSTVYLTFDDGPTPEVTPWVLEILKTEQVKATFFCIGDNIRKYPEIFKKVVVDGHSIGNHTFNHLNGWKTDQQKYIENFSQCQQEIENQGVFSDLFRPPYGKMTTAQTNKVIRAGSKIIMWDVLSADFDQNIAPEQCTKNATAKTTAGSIIIFHDSVKAFKNLQVALPETIRILKEKGYRFEKIV
ncbi:MAG: polysaccharide deacetylase family protein [Flavobacterium sp. BFFFF1]|uniref:polysaccharide deacetylase family protein n=1 Tax=Flavobacterium sp. BFFFF1 TaxID=2015557 RepID=UPI000BD0BFC7|nr:polysaccharide deacetylase family protein [Flavobacterium sp. BFFFF1]OYU82264.1 MAG: polysaccharide deacetylase family protein [Flavobacterium sp. BFFFF1]